MKLCQCCLTSAEEDSPTCVSCGEASWSGSVIGTGGKNKAEPKKLPKKSKPVKGTDPTESAADSNLDIQALINEASDEELLLVCNDASLSMEMRRLASAELTKRGK